MHNSATTGQLQRGDDSNSFRCVAKVLCPSYGFNSIIMGAALCTGGCVPCDGSSNTSKGNLQGSPKQSWSAVCCQPRALSLQPLSEAIQLVLPALTQTVTLTSELLVTASAVIAQMISKQQKSYLSSKAGNQQQTLKGDNHLDFYFCPAPGYVWSHFLVSSVWKGWVCDYCSLPTAAQDINVKISLWHFPP